MKERKNNWKKVLSLLLAIIFLVGMMPTAVFATQEKNEDTNNNQAGPVEEWNYVPQETNEQITLSENGEVSSDMVNVHVTAADKNTGEEVSVAGADVNLYVGTNLISTTTTNDSGIAAVSLAGLSLEDRHKATISSNMVVSEGKAIGGSARDALFRNFPQDSEGDYIRYKMELHSESIDTNGNWNGTELPMTTETNKVDIAFAIDATGSMSGEINNVKNNIASFSDNLIAKGLDIRFSIIEYRDITEREETIVHSVSGSHWFNDIDTVVQELQSIKVSGGGDTNETPLDALGYIADNSLMNWRSDAHKFAFVLTDAGYKTDNNYGYGSLADLTRTLKELNIITSVITGSGYKTSYSSLYETTGGIYANIGASDFKAEMLTLSNSIIEIVVRDMNLTLKEPRMLVNLAVCYFADDKKSMSESYRNSIRNMLNEYSNRLAETSDGHVLVDKIILFSTNNRLNFYDTNNIASMADIRIETEVKDDGKWLSNVQIHSNAHVTGFYRDDTYVAEYDEKNGANEHFTNLKNGEELDGRQSFYRIQLSGVEGAGWNNSLIDDAYAYSTTVAHESGHYLLGFFDEYLNADGDSWSDVGGKPYTAFGLMDNQHTDFEMSKSAIDYTYLSGNYSGANKNQHTKHSWIYKESCEDSLADLLLNDTNFSEFGGVVFNGDNFDYWNTGIYRAGYTKVTGNHDRNVGYSYAGLNDGDYISIDSNARTLSVVSTEAIDFENAVSTTDSLGQIEFAGVDDGMDIVLEPDSQYTYSLYVLKANAAEFLQVGLRDEAGVLKANLPIAKGELAEVRVVAEDADGIQYNTYYIDRSNDTSTGYMYTSADNRVEAYVISNNNSYYTFVADNTSYNNGEYVSVNQATRISNDNDVAIERGEIYSVASYMADIDYTSLSWFVYQNGAWNKLDTDYSDEETMNIGARADIKGEGLYVLMAKKTPQSTVREAENLSFTNSVDKDAIVTLSFIDKNTNSKYYNVYYSESEFADKNSENLVVRSYNADSTDLTLDLLERGRVVYAAVEIVLEDGSRSALSKLIRLEAGEADSDGDGIPDWYCDQYLLWGKDGEEKDIANSDDDGDGLTNLEEYKGGSDPKNPNDPEHTTNISVESITVSDEAVEIYAGDSINVKATVSPENATNKNINWTVEDENIASIDCTDNTCKITGLVKGETKVFAVAADGGYSAVINVTVSDSKPAELPFMDVRETDWFYDYVVYVYNKGLMTGLDETTFGPGQTLARAQFAVILHRMEESPDVEYSAKFKDVPDGQWYTDAVIWANHVGIITGYTDGSGLFGTSDNITREQMVTMMYRYAQYKGYDVSSSQSLSSFPDEANVNSFAEDAMKWAVEKKLIKGDNGKLNPQGALNRAECATIIQRFLEMK